jgi:hypothetical protein
MRHPCVTALFCCLTMLPLAACNGPPHGGADSPPAVSPGPARQPGDAGAPRQPGDGTPGGAHSVPPALPRHFDPAVLAPGDTFLGLRVAAVQVQRVFPDSVWAGRVRFHGRIRVTGTFRRHFDWPEPAELCFFPDVPASRARIPAFAPDAWTSADGITWFCFTNAGDVGRALGDGSEPVRATIEVDDYLVVREFSDVYDTARFMGVVSR